MNQLILRGSLLVLALSLGACASAPEQLPEADARADALAQPADYPEPVFAASRIVPADSIDVTSVYDPWEGMNKRIYNFNYHFDQWVFLPVVRGWRAVVPEPARVGVHNFFENFRDVRTMANSILQASPSKLMQSTGRVLVNSTIGLFGLIDVATSMGMPKPDEDFGQTLGHWGVGTGPYLVLPLLGPSNVRDGVGLYPDFMLQNYVQNDLLAQPVRATAFLFDSIDTRSNTSFRYYETGSAFEYQTVRWLYTTKRELDVEK
ncbi:MAG: VacJ family lipoprotein [Halieaceae bacterium]|nr:VacJ family lipoprotein [Halieaceae bacterium]MCP5188118.1 VacJ family lipoprotein [Pseudomonadales bacterium]